MKTLRNIPATARLAIAGLTLIAVGGAFIYWPAALIVTGAALLIEAATSRPPAPPAATKQTTRIHAEREV